MGSGEPMSMSDKQLTAADNSSHSGDQSSAAADAEPTSPTEATTPIIQNQNLGRDQIIRDVADADADDALNTGDPSVASSTENLVTIASDRNDGDYAASVKSITDGLETTATGDVIDGENIGDSITTSTSEWTKNRTSSSSAAAMDVEVGATQVDERAPRVNRRFYLGLDRLSARVRRTRARLERQSGRRMLSAADRPTADADGDDNNGGDRIHSNRQSSRQIVGRETTTGADDGEVQSPQGEGDSSNENITARNQGSTWRQEHIEWVRGLSRENLIAATLVEEDDGVREVAEMGEVVDAQPMSFVEQRSKPFLIAMCFLLGSMAVVVGVVLGTTSSPKESEAGTSDQQYCSPCIDRSKYKIKALLRADTESIKKKLVPSAHLSAKDMGVNLEVQIYDEGDDEQMADDIRSVAAESGAHALIVTVNSKAIANAVRYAADLKMPVVGVNSGFEFAEGPTGLVEDGSMLFFTAMDGRSGGEMAASYFLEQLSEEQVDGENATTFFSNLTSVDANKTYSRALFVSLKPPEKSISVFEQGYQGYRDRLMEVSNNTIKVERIQVEMPTYQEDLEKTISDCMYQSILIGESQLVQPIKLVMEESGCDQIKVGVFDRTPELDSELAEGELDFVMDQFHDMQGYAAVQMTTLYVTTGFIFPPPPGGVHFSGPSILTKQNTTTQEKMNICEEDPSAPGCFDRNNITIGGVVHGTGNDRYWDMVFSAAKQSAIDTGVALKLDRFGPEENLYEKMGSKIISLCKSGIAGLFVTLPDEGVIDAVRSCQELNPNLQILSINAGFQNSKELNLVHHIGMIEDDAGYQAGIKMVEMATIDKALCLNHDPGLNATIDRCKGFGRYINNMGIEYLGQITAQEDSSASYVSAVERAVGEPGDWDGYGVLLTGLMHLPAALELKKLHENLAMGAFDTDSLLYEALDTGDILFGVDQQPYLEGYLPIPFLMHAIRTKNSFAGHAFRTGPRFIIAPPTDELADCEDREYPVCSVKGK